jgi:hypothetical protein
LDKQSPNGAIWDSGILTPQEVSVLIDYYGLADGKRKNKKNTGIANGISGSRAIGILNRSYSKLGHEYRNNQEIFVPGLVEFNTDESRNHFYEELQRNMLSFFGK